MNIQQKQPESKEERIATWRKHIPEKYRGTYDKAMEGHSRQRAVLAKCQDCMNWQIAEVRNCEIVTCPLHPYRVRRAGSEQTNSSKDTQNEKIPELRSTAGVTR